MSRQLLMHCQTLNTKTEGYASYNNTSSCTASIIRNFTLCRPCPDQKFKVYGYIIRYNNNIMHSRFFSGKILAMYKSFANTRPLVSTSRQPLLLLVMMSVLVSINGNHNFLDIRDGDVYACERENAHSAGTRTSIR